MVIVDGMISWVYAVGMVMEHYWDRIHCTMGKSIGDTIYRSVPGKRPLPGKRPCTEFQGVTVAASIQTYGIYIPGKRPCGPKSRVMFKHPWALTRDTTVVGNFGEDFNWPFGEFDKDLQIKNSPI